MDGQPNNPIYELCAELSIDVQRSVDALAALDTMLLAMLAKSELRIRANGVHVLLRQQVDALLDIGETLERLAQRILREG